MDTEFFINITLAILLVGVAMASFFLILRRNSSIHRGLDQKRLKIVAQTRIGLKAQLVLVESGSDSSLIALSGDRIVPIWTHEKNDAETKNEM